MQFPYIKPKERKLTVTLIDKRYEVHKTEKKEYKNEEELLDFIGGQHNITYYQIKHLIIINKEPEKKKVIAEKVNEHA